MSMTLDSAVLAAPANEVAWNLVERTRAGDSAAFSDLYERCFPDVFSFVLGRTRDRELAEELTAETFFRALRRIDSVTYRGTPVLAWLITIARNIVTDEFRSARRRREVPWLEGTDRASDLSDPEWKVCQREEAAELWRSMSKLTDDQRQCLTLQFFEHRPVSEVARLMRKSEGSVRSLQARAVRRLADVLTTDVAVG